MSPLLLTTTALAGRIRSSTASLREDPKWLQERSRAVAALAWIAERDLLEAHPVVPGRARDVEVAVDNHHRPEAAVPVGGAHRAAPLRELGVAQHPRRLNDQREVVNQDR